MIAICLIAIVSIELADDDGDDLRKKDRESEKEHMVDARRTARSTERSHEENGRRPPIG